MGSDRQGEAIALVPTIIKVAGLLSAEINMPSNTVRAKLCPERQIILMISS